MDIDRNHRSGVDSAPRILLTVATNTLRSTQSEHCLHRNTTRIEQPLHQPNDAL
ncbi:hypothetical protein RBWH47_04636 [Rhodopirellula baltica WH47]|uniref:Uncharacterized protein n=1 Tax=Rhodopirellula baltica WH47 TaxID=991778 RepID=F2ASE9_RHOBT|nr:hypothetical protein RBWH47_04636 [Rhodopirellula baltica WH47]